MLSIVSILTGFIGNSALTNIENFIKYHGYEAIFGLMTLESSSLPIPSEVVLPFAGLLAAKHTLNFYYAFIAAFAGSILGIAVDYFIGYFIGKDVVYKHLKFFHIKKETLDNFDKWFEKNAIPAVFFSRLVPVVRTIISLPAGFAKMPKKQFFFYSAVGAVIWNAMLMAFGYYLLSSTSAIVILTSIGIFAILLYLLYIYAMRKMRK